MIAVLPAISPISTLSMIKHLTTKNGHKKRPEPHAPVYTNIQLLYRIIQPPLQQALHPLTWNVGVDHFFTVRKAQAGAEEELQELA